MIGLPLPPGSAEAVPCASPFPRRRTRSLRLMRPRWRRRRRPLRRRQATPSWIRLARLRAPGATGLGHLHVTVVTPGAVSVVVTSGTGGARAAARRNVRWRKTDAAALGGRGAMSGSRSTSRARTPRDSSTTDPAVALDVYHQPADVSFVLTNLLSLSATPGNALSGLLDPARVGLVGTSSGAVTGLLFFNTCCTDGRISRNGDHQRVPVADCGRLAGDRCL